MTIKWVSKETIITMHALLLEEHGGLSGACNEQMVESTLARPQNLHAYSDGDSSLEALAAAYGYGFSKNHCFTDGNKRVALVSIDVFLQINGCELIASEIDAAATMLDLAAGEIEEEELAEWIGGNIQKLST